jgi:hypothetical protein
MTLRRICLGILAVLLAGCTKEYKTKPTLVVSEALGQRIQAAMIEFGGKNPEFAELIRKTVENRQVRIVDQFIPGDATAEKYLQKGMITKQLFIGDWVLNREKMLIACTETFENGTNIIYQAPFTVTDGKVAVTKIMTNKSTIPVNK